MWYKKLNNKEKRDKIKYKQTLLRVFTVINIVLRWALKFTIEHSLHSNKVLLAFAKITKNDEVKIKCVRCPYQKNSIQNNI